MDVSTVLDYGLTLAAAAGGYILRTLHIKTETTQKDLADYKEKAAERFVTKEDITSRFEKVENRLDDIYKLLVNRDRP